MYKKIILGLLVASSVQVATAKEYGAIAPKISTLGLGVEYKYPVTNNVSVSAGIYGGNYSRDESTDDVDYSLDLRLRNFTLLGNYYPWDNGFHFAGGVVLNGTKVEGFAKPKGGQTYTFNDVTYSTEQIGSADAKIDFRKVAPYLGLGWDNGNKGGAGWSVAASAGVMFSGSPEVDLNVTCTQTLLDLDKQLGQDNCGKIKKDAEAERAELQDDLDSFKAYPVLSIGVMYRF